MYKTENRLNNSVSRLSIEEIYTNLDINPYETLNPQVGYTFCYPQRWLENPSQNKAIGIRRLDIIPSNHVLSLIFAVKKPTGITEEPPAPITVDIEILSRETLIQALSNIRTFLNNYFKTYAFYYKYKNNGDLNISCKYIGSVVPVNAEFSIGDELALEDQTENIDEFLMFLNQDLSDDNRKYLDTLSEVKTFHNVWDREYLEFHASFSDSKRRFIGIKGDFYEKPNVLYNAPTDGSTFNIRFTTNGKNNIYPKYCRFIIQLVFLYNYRRTVVL